MIAAFHVLEMIKNYKKCGTSATSDITPGLFDHFYIDPAFDPEIYKEVVQPPLPSDEADSDGLAERFLDSFGEPAFFRPAHSMPTHINSAAALMKSSNKRTTGASTHFKLTVDDSLAAELAEFYGHNNDEDVEENHSETKENVKNEDEEDDNGVKRILPGIPAPTDYYIPPHRIDNGLGPPPGFASKKIDLNDHDIVRDSNDDKPSAKFEVAPAATYRHLILQPRSIPITPLTSLVPPTPPV